MITLFSVVKNKYFFRGDFMAKNNSPLFRDPIYDGATDPTVIWNNETKEWWLCYTQRRATDFNSGVTYVHGTDIGVATSSDFGKTWVYRGILEGLEFENGRNTFWAPEIIYAQGKYHMYCSYIRGIPSDWEKDHFIVHYTSTNLWNWKFESVLSLSSNRVIDACVYEVENGTWKMWYKDEINNCYSYSAISHDLYNWEIVGPEIKDCPHEGPNVFEFGGVKWMITDHWKGLGVYCTEDFSNWCRCKDLLNTEESKRIDDSGLGHHGDVLVINNRAFLFYFVHPQQNIVGDNLYVQRRSSVQVVELFVENGHLICNRDLDVNLDLTVN